MRTLTTDAENIRVVEEPQLAVKFYSKPINKKEKKKANLP
ncbi:hypothetical protein MNBD_BACTEROID03-858 [hydrothermal vent metagenome]|uniref:Uncharacterized protein n=1 Tax=hydrothermal vent metagenome TaxID=652676 RepID=A0A3B0SWA1_9ZZZZ